MPWFTDLNAIQHILDFGMMLLIWLVQLIIYPVFLHVRADEFKAWHYKYTGLISLFVCPLMFGQVGIYAFLCWTEASLPAILGCLLIVIAWAATFLLSVPCHDKLQKEGFDAETIRRLIHTNWIRTFVWSAIFGLDLVF